MKIILLILLMVSGVQASWEDLWGAELEKGDKPSLLSGSHIVELDVFVMSYSFMNKNRESVGVGFVVYKLEKGQSLLSSKSVRLLILAVSKSAYLSKVEGEHLVIMDASPQEKLVAKLNCAVKAGPLPELEGSFR